MTEYGRTPAEVAAVRQLRRALSDTSNLPRPSPELASVAPPPPRGPDHRTRGSRAELGRDVGVLGGLVVAIGIAVLAVSSGGAIDVRVLDVLLGALAILAGVLALRVWWDVVRVSGTEPEVGSGRTIDLVSTDSHVRSSGGTVLDTASEVEAHAIPIVSARSRASWRCVGGGAETWLSP